MTQSQKTFYITTTLPYVNGDPHIGFAMEIIRADVIARYKKTLGYDVFFNTGTDEHGLKLYETAKERGMEIMDFLNEISSVYKKLLGDLNILEDIHFIRTTDEHHKKSAQALWKKVQDNGYIYKKNYQTKYCVGCEENKTDSELVDGKCPLHPNRELEIIDEENYFFKLSALQDELFTLFESNPKLVIPETRLNEMKEFVRRGLEDFSISRLKSKMPWGIDVPGDNDHVMYVWFDALTNYISTLGWPENENDDVDNGTDNGNYNKYWVNGTPVQYCGKDNTRFQSITWQSMLLAAKLPTTHNIIINGWITGEGGVKMSKSLGNTINPSDIVKEYGADALRFFVTKELQPFEDSPFAINKFKEVYNAHLANGIGNLVSRMMKMATSYEAKLSEEDISSIPSLKEDKNIENFRLDLYTQEIFDEFTKLDQFIQKEEPFKKFKVDPESARKDLVYLQVKLLTEAYKLAIIMPETSASIIDCILNHKMPEAPLFLRKD
jgi:methionyl-tRNA synthetase